MTPPELISFVSERLDEDERAAQAASEESWTYEYGEFQSRGGEDFDHILRHGPARVLRDVAADRKLIELCEKYLPVIEDGSAHAALMWHAGRLAERVLNELAAKYGVTIEVTQGVPTVTAPE
jgi:hypothetical protein